MTQTVINPGDITIMTVPGYPVMGTTTKGLGGEVWKAIQRLQMGRGFEAGIAIVIVAMILDRVLQKLGTRKDT